jgi:hypothetical protein
MASTAVPLTMEDSTLDEPVWHTLVSGSDKKKIMKTIPSVILMH